NYPIFKREKTVDPLVYQFETDVLFFPLEISSMLEGNSIIRLAMFTSPDIPLDLSVLDDVLTYRHRSYEFVSSEILSYIDTGIHDMFPNGAIHEYYVFNLPLSRVRGDVIIPRDDMISWADTFNEYLRWNFDANIYHIPELDLIIYEKRNSRGLVICCRDFEDGELAWEWVIPCEPYDPPHYFGMFVEDIDQDGSRDILVYAKDSYNDDLSIVRLDPLTGEKIEIELPELDFIPEKGQVFMDSNGSKYFGFLSEYKMIVIDPETMNCIATLEMPETDGDNGRPRIPLNDYAMHTWDGIGNGLSFRDGYHRYAWSPFHQLSEEERNSSGFCDDNVIWQQDFFLQFELVRDGITYWFGARWVGHEYETLFIYDPDTGYQLEEVSYEEFPELKDCLEYLVFDFDDNGEDELIAIYNDRSQDEMTFHIACLDPISGRRYWDTELILGDYWFRGLKVVDLGGDGTPVFIIHSKDTVNVVDSADGTIIWWESDSRLLEGNPDLNGDGR
ncbi:MAG: PQQ-like beta-propeller repeat protein, partial [Thermoplasmata archaeon]|nr:PQQ-like beta-propeller repeat protein [Thermoplasmata archaeon]